MVLGMALIAIPAFADSFVNQAEQLATLRAEVTKLANTLRDDQTQFQNITTIQMFTRPLRPALPASESDALIDFGSPACSSAWEQIQRRLVRCSRLVLVVGDLGALDVDVASFFHQTHAKVIGSSHSRALTFTNVQHLYLSDQFKTRMVPEQFKSLKTLHLHFSGKWSGTWEVTLEMWSGHLKLLETLTVELTSYRMEEWNAIVCVGLPLMSLGTRVLSGAVCQQCQESALFQFEHERLAWQHVTTGSEARNSLATICDEDRNVSQ